GPHHLLDRVLDAAPETHGRSLHRTPAPRRGAITNDRRLESRERAARGWLALGAAPGHLLQALPREGEPLGGARLGAAFAQRLLDHAPVELLDRVVEGEGRGGARLAPPQALRELSETDRLSGVGESHRALDLVLQLAHVAREGIGAQAAQGFRRDPGHRPPRALAVDPEEVLGEGRDVLDPLAERR